MRAEGAKKALSEAGLRPPAPISLFRRSEFLRVPGFDENFTANSYGDDYDLAIRLAEQGGKTVYDPMAALTHLQVPAGGLRLKDASNAFTEKDKALSVCLFFCAMPVPAVVGIFSTTTFYERPSS